MTKAREVIAKSLDGLVFADESYAPVQAQVEKSCRRMADSILSALDKAGFVIVPKELPEDVANQLTWHFDNDVVLGYDALVNGLWHDAIPLLAAHKESGEL